ncbi:MAG: hypothetical protein WA532_15520 [Candidatus Korobacteraceae bacterium]
MIFGFNTDIAAEGTVYHVQTEVREQESRLESQVFVRGRCIGKRGVVLPPGATEEEIQELARAQHRWVVEAVRGGFVDEALRQDLPSQDLPNRGVPSGEKAEALTVELLGSKRVSVESVMLSFRVLSGGSVAGQAEMTASWKIESAAGVLQSVFTDDAGVAEMRLGLTGGEAELEVKAQLEGRETTRRFLIKSARKAPSS